MLGNNEADRPFVFNRSFQWRILYLLLMAETASESAGYIWPCLAFGNVHLQRGSGAMLSRAAHFVKFSSLLCKSFHFLLPCANWAVFCIVSSSHKVYALFNIAPDSINTSHMLLCVQTAHKNHVCVYNKNESMQPKLKIRHLQQLTEI